MPKTNPTTPGQTDNETDGGSSSDLESSDKTRCVKSFRDLGEAVLERDIDRFSDLIRKGIDNWRTAGSLLVEMARTTTDLFKKIQDRNPNISLSTLETFMRIGRKEIWPPLLVDSSYGARRLMECNYDIQKKYSEEPIEVAIEWRGDKIRSIKKKISELSRSEIAIVFDGQGGMNNLEQQAFRLPSSFRSSSRAPIAAPLQNPIQYKAPVRISVDIGYFKLTAHKDGTVTSDPCEKSSDAQPVRIVNNTATIVCYKQETK